MLERLHNIEININELEKFKQNTNLKEVKSNLQKQWILRYGLFECIQVVIDISCHMVAKYNLGNPKTYTECVELLTQYDYLDKHVADNIIPMIGLRNLLIYEYTTIHIDRLYNLLNNLDDFIEFVQQIKQYV